MKIRKGFISNSSSSSFIMGIANVSKSNNKDCYFDFIFDVKDIVVPHSSWRTTPYLNSSPMDILVKDLNNGTYELTIESFTGRRVSCIVENGDKVICVDGIGPDEDSFFKIDDDWELDYDKIDINDFNDCDVSTYYTIQELGGDYTYGAGRNG